jgi:hypothetical protein
VGRTLRVELTNGAIVEGLLKNTSHDTISLELKPVDKKSQPESKEIPFEEIKEAYVTIQFGKK